MLKVVLPSPSSLAFVNCSNGDDFNNKVHCGEEERKRKYKALQWRDTQ